MPNWSPASLGRSFFEVWRARAPFFLHLANNVLTVISYYAYNMHAKNMCRVSCIHLCRLKTTRMLQDLHCRDLMAKTCGHVLPNNCEATSPCLGFIPFVSRFQDCQLVDFHPTHIVIIHWYIWNNTVWNRDDLNFFLKRNQILTELTSP